MVVIVNIWSPLVCSQDIAWMCTSICVPCQLNLTSREHIHQWICSLCASILPSLESHERVPLVRIPHKPTILFSPLRCVFLCFNDYKPKTHAYGMALSRSFSVGHGLLGASPLDPLVHISNPSPYTHAKSQFPCSISLDFFFFQTVQIKNTYICFIGQ